MPMPYFDFTKNPLQRLDTSPYQNLLSGALGGYQQGQKFKQEGQQFEQEQEKRALSNEEQAMMNNLLKLYGEEKEKSQLALLKAQTQRQLNPITSTQRELAEAFGTGSPEYKRALRQQYGVYDNESSNIPEDIPKEVIGRSYSSMPKNEQLLFTKEMTKNLDTAIGMKESLKILDQLEDLIDKNPDLWNSFSLLIQDPGMEEKGLIPYIKGKSISGKTKEAIDKVKKLSNDLVAKGASALGGQRQFTDARQALYESIKPNIRNTPGANKMVIANMRDLMSPGPGWEKALQYGLKNGVSIIRDDEAFKREFANKQINKNQQQDSSAENSNKMVTIKNEKTGETKTVTYEEAKKMGAR